MPEEPANVNATSALPDDIREAVAVSDVKTVAEATAFNQNLMNSNSIANQQAMHLIMQASVGKITESIIATSPGEGGVDVATLGQLMKGLELTPPRA